MIYYFIMKFAELCSLDKDPLTIEVSTLKRLICAEQGITEDNIIMIANGGLCVQDGALSVYNCGDDETNPVFVYLRQPHKKVSVSVAADSVCVSAEQQQVQAVLDRVRSVVTKAITAQGGNGVLREHESVTAAVTESARKVCRQVEAVVRDQYLLVEGWTAAVANLCDSLQAIERRLAAMKVSLRRFEEVDLEEGYQMLAKFEERKARLEMVPLLRGLLGDVGGDAEQPENLLQWVLHRDKGTKRNITVQSLVTEADEAYLTLLGISGGLGVPTLEELRASWGKEGMVETVIAAVRDGEDLVQKCRPVQLQCQEDCEEEPRSLPAHHRDHYTSNKAYMERLEYLATVRTRCSQLLGLVQSHKDYIENTVKQCSYGVSPSVLQDHCVSARQQMENLARNYAQLAEWLNKVNFSKSDLVKNIDERKSWLMKYETSICKIDETLFLTKEKIKRVRAGCRVLEQMSTAPRLYAQCVTEIRRRQQTLDLWYTWGTRCSKQSRDLRRKDHELRMIIDQDLENHFIQSLFSSLHSFFLPKIGHQLLNSTPHVLPLISEDDVNTIATSNPDLIPFLKMPQVTLDLSRSVSNEQINASSTTDHSLESSQNIADKRTGDSCLSIEDVSLMPVPSDNHMLMHDLCLSVRGVPLSHHHSDTALNVAGSSEGDSSKMARSIDSMDFQLTNDKTTETGRDIVCVSRSVFDSLSSKASELRSSLSAVQEYHKHHIAEQNTLVEETKRMLAQRATETDNDTLMVSSSSVCMRHKEFSAGDTVGFVGHLIAGALQWQMLTTDHRIYFLHDDSMPTSLTPRKDSVQVTSCEEPLARSQQSQVVARASLPRSQLVWGTFVSREEYLSKKVTNRFNLPVGTKFFRVRAHIDWSVFC